MRIHVTDIAPEAKLAITGDEPWLKKLYEDFPVEDDGPAPKLTGSLVLRREEGGSIKVTGHLEYAPMVSCSRCTKPILWPLAVEVEERFLPAAANPMRRDMNLSSADLDAYYLEEQQVDVEGLINDLVQTELPLRLTPAEDNGSCRVCHADVSDERVFGQGQAEGSPFAVLKQLTKKR